MPANSEIAIYPTKTEKLPESDALSGLDAVLVPGAAMQWNPKTKKFELPLIVPEDPQKVVMGVVRVYAALGLYSALKELGINDVPFLTTGGKQYSPAGDLYSRSEVIASEIIEAGVPEELVHSIGTLPNGSTEGNFKDLARYIKENPDAFEGKTIAVLVNIWQHARLLEMFKQFNFFAEQGFTLICFLAEGFLEKGNAPSNLIVEVSGLYAEVTVPGSLMYERMKKEKEGIDALKAGTYQSGTGVGSELQNEN